MQKKSTIYSILLVSLASGPARRSVAISRNTSRQPNTRRKSSNLSYPERECYVIYVHIYVFHISVDSSPPMKRFFVMEINKKKHNYH